MPTLAPPEIRERLIVALDVPNAAAARQLVQQLGESISYVKVGLQLFTAEGPAIVRDLVASGRKVFLDLKLHDIPNTVAHAVKSAVALGPSLLTVHGSGGAAMLRAAVEAAGGRTSILAVTVLTSLNDEDLQEIGFASGSVDQALRIASLAQSAGCAGVVSSAREVSALRKMLGQGFGIVVPGVRPLGENADDQARTATPAEAIQAGATQIVVGRPITKAPDPVQAAEAILGQIASVSKS
jgi:orotidine-5'-phosphate decarboxylase